MKRDDRPGGGKGAALTAPTATSGVAPRMAPAAERQLQAALALELEGEVRKRWRMYYPTRAQLPEPTVRFIPRQCGYSAIFKVDLEYLPNGHESLIIKVRREHKHGSFARSALSERTVDLVRTEYEQHVAAYRFFAGNPDGLTVVRPLDFIESHNALAVEHAVGGDLSKLVSRRSPLAAAAIERCGRWWRTFHYDLHAAKPRDWRPDDVERMLEPRFRRLAKFGVPAALLAAISEDIRAAAERLGAAVVPSSLVHGDCKLRHVWATSAAIQVLDFGNTKIGDSWTDPAALIVELSLFSLWSHRLDAASMTPAMRTLLRAYFGGPPPRLFGLYVVDCLLKKWHRRLRNWGPGTGLTRMRRSLQTARLDKPVERLYIDRWFSGQIRAWLAAAEGRPPAWLLPVTE